MTKTKIFYVCKTRWSTYGFFNVNAYPQSTRRICEASSERAAIFRFQVENINNIIKRDREDFFRQLLANKESLMKGVEEKPELNLLIYYDGLEYLTSLHGIFNSLKSLLDVYTQLMCKIISPSQTMTFNRAKIGGKYLSGGRFVNWLKESSPSTYKNSQKLSAVITKHSEDWLSEVILNYRDRLFHYGDIEGLNHMHINSKDLSIDFKSDYIKNPIMPNGKEVTTYCVGLLIKLGDFIDQTLKLLPNVDLSLIRRGDFSSI